MNRGRRALIAAVLAPVPMGAFAERARTYRIAILDQWYSAAPTSPARDFVSALEGRGYRQGRTIALEWHHGAGDLVRVERLADEIVAKQPDAIVAMGGIATRAAARATRTIPILAWTEDPVKDGYAHGALLPTRNVTGFADQAAERVSKGFELLKAFMPDLAAFGILKPAENAIADEFARTAQHHAGGLGLRVVAADFRTRADLEEGLSYFARSGVRAAMVWPAPGLASVRELVESALRHRIALVSEGLGARQGVLLTFSPEVGSRRMAAQLDKILRGVPIATIPFELPERYVVAVNRRTATALGLPIPRNLEVLADRVFDDWADQPKGGTR